jgi:hypothetical protein
MDAPDGRDFPGVAQVFLLERYAAPILLRIVDLRVFPQNAT